jgi:hypothetical protein
MDYGRILSIAFAISTIGLILLLSRSFTQEPTPLSSITHDNIGSRVYVKGQVGGLRPSPDGHLFFLMGTHYRWGTWIIISILYPKKRMDASLDNF